MINLYPLVRERFDDFPDLKYQEVIYRHIIESLQKEEITLDYSCRLYPMH